MDGKIGIVCGRSIDGFMLCGARKGHRKGLEEMGRR
jgi:hypothetical protein